MKIRFYDKEGRTIVIKEVNWDAEKESVWEATDKLEKAMEEGVNTPGVWGLEEMLD